MHTDIVDRRTENKVSDQNSFTLGVRTESETSETETAENLPHLLCCL